MCMATVVSVVVCQMQCRDCQRASMVDGRQPGRVDVPAGAVDAVDARLSSSLLFFASVGVAALEVSNGEGGTPPL